MKKRIKGRYAKERRFRIFSFAALFSAGVFLLLLLGNITYNGVGGFIQSKINLEVTFDAGVLRIDPALEGEDLMSAINDANYSALIRTTLMEKFPDVSARADVRKLQGIISIGARDTLRNMLMENPTLLGQSQDVWLLTSDDIDLYIKGRVSPDIPENERRVTDAEMTWVNTFIAEDRTKETFHTRFFTAGDSREPELAGVAGAMVGSFLTLIVTLLVAFPTGVMAAIYLEEFAPKNRWTDLIEVNINNLAAVPSIIFGLLGLAIFLNFFELPRSAPLVGGLTLALMTLPTIIIASRAAILAVPPSIREGAIGLGASKMQVVFHHVVPLALPGILTGTIIGMARALGETAPLLMIGMVAFIVDIPSKINDAATVLPVQIFIWADSPERAFVEKTSAAIMVLLVFLILMNSLAIWLRNKFERKW
jgi:phosphate transport system permease protein